MSWICPYQINDECLRLKKPCHPSQKGCVLEGKVTFIDNQLDSNDKKDFKREGKQNGKVKPNYGI